MDIITVLLMIAAIVIFYLWFRRHDPSLPPCPVSPLPIFGHLLYLGTNPRPVFKQWRKKCGDIYSLYFGQNLVVVLNGYDLIKEALVQKADVFSDRPYVLYDAILGKSGTGLGFSSGALWKEQRTVTMSILRALGMGKNTMSDKISDIAATNNELIAQLNGQPTDLDDILTTGTSSVICSVMLGLSFQHNDKEFLKACDSIRENILDADARNPANYFPFLRHLPGDNFKVKRVRNRAMFVMHSFLEPFIKRCVNEDIGEHNLDNFIALYMSERIKKLNAGESTYLDDVNLRKVVYDLFGAGMETTSNTLKWAILYMLHYADVQEKVYREIEKEVGTERSPNMSDKSKLPYLNAFIQEVQRISSIIPLNLMHMCSETTILGGYSIPKGTQIIPSLDSILFDKKIRGEDTDVFKPERFLDENGKLKCPEQFVPFSLGRRICAGESLARMELFLFLSSMIQQFKFLPPDQNELPSLAPRFGLTTSPTPFKVRAVDRKM